MLSKVPEKIAKLSFCAAVEGSGTASKLRSGYVRIVAGGQEVMRYSFTGADFGTERAIIICDLYRKGVWRAGAVGQGFAGGLADLIRSYGGTVDDEPAPAPPTPVHAPPPGPPAADAAGLRAAPRTAPWAAAPAGLRPAAGLAHRSRVTRPSSRASRPSSPATHRSRATRRRVSRVPAAAGAAGPAGVGRATTRAG